MPEQQMEQFFLLLSQSLAGLRQPKTENASVSFDSVASTFTTVVFSSR